MGTDVRYWSTLACMAAMACGGESFEATEEDQAVGAGGEENGSQGGNNQAGSSSGIGGALASGGSGQTGEGSCPGSVPENGSACTPIGSSQDALTQAVAHCSWGEDPRPQCRTTGLCMDGQWQISEPSDPVCSQPALGEACPAAPPAAMSECADATLSCWYDDGTRCSCSACAGGSEFPVCQTIDPPEWACASPGPGCPAFMPQAGSACDEEGASCGPNCDLEIVCEAGRWRWRRGMCPICAAPDTPIATPQGERALASLRAGDWVYSVHEGAIMAVVVLRVAHTPVSGHRVLRVELDTGAVLRISAGHPTADGRTFGDLQPGSQLDARHTVESIEWVPFTDSATYDLLPASSSQAYFAAGALVGSSLTP